MSDTSKLKSLGSNTTKYDYECPDKNILEAFEYIKKQETNAYSLVKFVTDEFTSLCPKTGQPDFASIDITYWPDKHGVESKSLKLYLFSYRNHGSFHEDCVSQICVDIAETINPLYLRVIGDFTRRGGIAIKPTAWYSREDLDVGDVINYFALSDQYEYKR